MDINQNRFRQLLRNTDITYEQYKLHPQSENYAQAYEQAKQALDGYLADIRLSLPEKQHKN